MRHIEAADARRNGKVVRQSILSRLSSVFNIFLCGQYGETERSLKIVVKKKEKSSGSERKKRQAEESDEEELGCNELLEKLANEDNSNDSSFAVSVYIIGKSTLPNPSFLYPE